MKKEFLGMMHHVIQGVEALWQINIMSKKKKSKNSGRDSKHPQSYIHKALFDCPLWTQMCQKGLGISYYWATPRLRSGRPELYHIAAVPLPRLWGKAIQGWVSSRVMDPVSFPSLCSSFTTWKASYYWLPGLMWRWTGCCSHATYLTSTHKISALLFLDQH